VRNNTLSFLALEKPFFILQFGDILLVIMRATPPLLPGEAMQAERSPDPLFLENFHSPSVGLSLCGGCQKWWGQRHQMPQPIGAVCDKTDDFFKVLIFNRF
jgi:hypothetical protein